MAISLSRTKPEPRPIRSLPRWGLPSCQQVRHTAVAHRLAATMVTTSRVAGLLPGSVAIASVENELGNEPDRHLGEIKSRCS